MEVIEWEDETNYSRGDVERVPRTWAAKGGGLKISVHRHIHHEPDDWLLTCAPWFNCQVLPSKAAPVAKRQALDLVQERLHAALVALHDERHDTGEQQPCGERRQCAKLADDQWVRDPSVSGGDAIRNA